MAQREIKGGAVKGILNSVKIKWGEQGLKSAMQYTGINTMPKSSEWISLKQMYMLLEWIDKEHGERYIISVGRSMPKNMAGDLKFMFASFMSFERMLKRVQKEISKMLFKGNGVIIKKLKDREVIVTLKDVNVYEKSCLLWKGALLGVMDASKIKGKVDVIKSESVTDCSFRVTWQ